MRIRLDQITIRYFKRIEALTIDLKPVTALVGGNMSGKSSALQAAQLGVSILQAALRSVKADGTPDFAGTVSNDSVLFRPTEHLLDLRRGYPATQKLGYSITYSGVDLDSGADKSLTIEVRRGKNANIAINRQTSSKYLPTHKLTRRRLMPSSGTRLISMTLLRVAPQKSSKLAVHFS